MFPMFDAVQTLHKYASSFIIGPTITQDLPFCSLMVTRNCHAENSLNFTVVAVGPILYNV